jgi:Flp pilus assembly protein TadD
MSRPRKLATISLACAISSCASQPTPSHLTVKPITEIRHAAGIDSLDPYQRGAQYQARGDLDKALQAYKAAVTSDYRHGEARNAMATIYMQRGQAEEAQAILREAIAQRPNAAYLRNNLGYIDYLQGNHEAAIKELNAALSLDADNDWARNNLKMAQDALSKTSPAVAAQLAAVATPPGGRAAIAAAPFEIWGEADLPNPAMAPVTAPAVVTALQDEPVIAQPVASPQDLVATASKEYRLEICNSSGVAGLAKRLSESLSRLGVPVNTITSKAPYRKTVTEVEYKDGFEFEARQLAEKLNSRALVKRVSSADAVDVRVVLGKDINTQMASIEARNMLHNAVSAGAPAEQVAVPSLNATPATPLAATEPLKAAVAEPLKLDDAFSFVKPYELHVVNANGVRGIARQASDFLRGKGVVAHWVGDQRPYQSVTQIEYRDGYLLEAARLRASLPNQPMIVKNESAIGIGAADIKLVLGRDLIGKAGLFWSSGTDLASSGSTASKQGIAQQAQGG